MLHKAVRGALLVDTWLTRGARLFSCYDRHGSPPPYQMRHAVTCPFSTDTQPTQITALWVVHARVQRGARHLVTEMSFAFIIYAFIKRGYSVEKVWFLNDNALCLFWNIISHT